MIFNKDNNGIEEFKQFIGFIYASVNFGNLTTYIELAEREIVGVIGKQQFQQALDHYHSDNYKLAEKSEDHPEYELLDTLVTKVQLPVALHAYRRYVPSNDLSHSDKGRQIFVSENEKPAFDWMIQRDNENLMRLASDATELLLEFLDDNILQTYMSDDPVLDWYQAGIVNRRKFLFIKSAIDFETVFPIGKSRLLFNAMVPLIKRVQEAEIRACFTAEKWHELKVHLADYDLTDNDLDEWSANEDIIERIKPPLALLSMAKAVKRFSSELLPSGVFTSELNAIEGKKPAGKVDRNEIAASIEADGRKELQKLQEYMSKLTLEQAGETYEIETRSDAMDETQKYVRL